MDLNDGAAAGGGDASAAAGGGDAAAGTAADFLGGDDNASKGGDANAGGGDAGGDAGKGGADSGADGGASDDFLNNFSAEVGEGESASHRDVVKAKGWKSLDDVVKGYREAERALRDGGGRVKVPAEDASDEEVAAYRSAIGVPENAEGYTMPTAKDAEGNDIPLNDGLMARIAEAGHKHGVPKEALEGVMQAELDAQIAEHDATVKDLQKQANEHVKGWGEDRDAKLANVDAAARDNGLSREDMDYLRGMPSGPGKMLDMLAKYGANFSEDTIVNGQKRSFGMTAEQAKADLAAIKADPALRDKAMVPGSPENARYNRALEAVAAAADKAAAG